MKNVFIENLNQLTDFLHKISETDYVSKPAVLSGSSIGQHIRHILEFYLLLIDSANNNTICYDKRDRDNNIENSKAYAIQVIAKISVNISNLDSKKTLNMKGDFTKGGDSEQCIISSVGREMAYCVEHSIHHQAIIKAGLIEMNLKNLVDENFGVAYSTIRHKKNVCAQ